MTRFIRLLSLVCTTALCTVAKADTITLTSPLYPFFTSIITLPHMPVADAFTLGYNFITVATTSNTDSRLGFGSALQNSDFALLNPRFPDATFTGPQLYTGPESAPTLVDAIYTVYNGGYAYELQITPDATVTPEPSSLALLATGLLGVFSASRRRQR